MNETIKRDEMIDYIMTNHFNTDDTLFNYHTANKQYLNEMSDEELERLYDSILN